MVDSSKKRKGHDPLVTERNKTRNKEREKRNIAKGRKALGNNPTVPFKANVEVEETHRRRQLDDKNLSKFLSVPFHAVHRTLKKRLRGKEWTDHRTIKEKLKEAHSDESVAV